MPTIGQIRFDLSRLRLAGLAVAFTAGFERVDSVPLVFFREGDALDIAFRFAAMGPVYVRVSRRITQAAIKHGMQLRAC
jgi:hypothetical protein